MNRDRNEISRARAEKTLPPSSEMPVTDGPRAPSGKFRAYPGQPPRGAGISRSQRWISYLGTRSNR